MDNKTGLMPGDTVYLVSQNGVRPHTFEGFKIDGDRLGVIVKASFTGASIHRIIPLEEKDRTWFTDQELAQKTYETEY